MDIRQAAEIAISIYMGNALSYTTDVSVPKIVLSFLAGLLVYIGQIAVYGNITNFLENKKERLCNKFIYFVNNNPISTIYRPKS